MEPRGVVKGLNYVGASVTTRFLYSVMAGRLYNSKLAAKKKRLKTLVSCFARDVGSCFDTPIQAVEEGEVQASVSMHAWLERRLAGAYQARPAYETSSATHLGEHGWTWNMSHVQRGPTWP